MTLRVTSAVNINGKQFVLKPGDILTPETHPLWVLQMMKDSGRAKVVRSRKKKTTGTEGGQ